MFDNPTQLMINDLSALAHVYARLKETQPAPYGDIYKTMNNIEKSMFNISEDMLAEIETGGYLSDESGEFDDLDTEEPKYLSYSEAMLMANDNMLVTRAMWVSEDKMCGVRGDTKYCVERKNTCSPDCCDNPESCTKNPLKGIIQSSITYIPTQEDIAARDWYILTEIPWD